MNERPPGAGSRHDAAPGRIAAVGALVFCMALFARLSNMPEVFPAGAGPVIGPYDELYHAARIVFSAQNPGSVLQFDPNRGLRGGFCPWPPLYDLAAGNLARILGGSTPERVLARAVWFPPIVGALFAGVVAIAVARRRGSGAGFLAGAGVALSYPFLEVSRTGDIDHHFLEPPLLFAIIAATIELERVRDRRSAVRSGALMAAALVAALFVQPALLLAAAVSMICILLLPRTAVLARWSAAGGFAAASAAVELYRLALPVGYPEGAWFLGTPHAAALLAAAVACAASAAALSRGAEPAGATTIGLVIGGLAGASVPGTIEGIVSGAGFFRGDPWLRTIVEFQPIFFSGWAGAANGLCRLGGGALLVIAFGPFVLRRSGPERRVGVLFAIAYLAASLGSARFLVCGGPLFAVVGALIVADARGRHSMTAVGGALVLLGPSLWISAPLVARPEPVIKPGALPFYRAAQSLRAASPLPQRVLAPWSWGHVFEFIGLQAPVVDGFGSSIGVAEFDDALYSVLLPREEAVADYCVRNGIRWVVLENPFQRLTVQAETVGLSPQFFVRAGPHAAPRILPLMRFSLWWRAYFDGGREVREPTRFAPAFRRFRLIYRDPQVSDGPARFRGPAVEIWEVLAAPTSPPGEPFRKRGP